MFFICALYTNYILRYSIQPDLFWHSTQICSLFLFHFSEALFFPWISEWELLYRNTCTQWSQKTHSINEAIKYRELPIQIHAAREPITSVLGNNCFKVHCRGQKKYLRIKLLSLLIQHFMKLLQKIATCTSKYQVSAILN